MWENQILFYPIIAFYYFPHSFTSHIKDAKSTCQNGCKASLNIGENMMTKIRQCLSEFHDNPYFNLFPSDDEQNINSTMTYVELVGDFVQCVVRFYYLPSYHFYCL